MKWLDLTVRLQGPSVRLELVFTVCSIVQAANCLEEYTMMIGCMIGSQFEGANWVGTHPNYYIAPATCQPAGQFAKL